LKLEIEDCWSERPVGIAYFGMKITTLLYYDGGELKPAAQIIEKANKSGTKRTSMLEIDYRGIRRRGVGTAYGERKLTESLIESLHQAGVKTTDPFPEKLTSRTVLEKLAEALKLTDWKVTVT